MRGSLSSRRLARLAANSNYSLKIRCRSLSTSPPKQTTPETDTQPKEQQQQKVIFSGIQPTGIPHLGNYLGALQQWKRMQDTALPSTKLIFCIVDLHAITVRREPGLLSQYKKEMLASFLAIGLDPERSTIFYQSSCPAHSELQWILSCTASMGYLSRMTQWKSKMNMSEDQELMEKKVLRKLKHGLFSYPILQAADVLVHRATHVPVGKDQAQHLEFARECVTNFNAAYGGKYLVYPETILCGCPFSFYSSLFSLLSLPFPIFPLFFFHLPALISYNSPINPLCDCCLCFDEDIPSLNYATQREKP